MVAAEGTTTVFALLEERRAKLAAERARVVNQLRALSGDLVPGGAGPISRRPLPILRTERPAWPVECTCKELACDLVREIGQLHVPASPTSPPA